MTEVTTDTADRNDRPVAVGGNVVSVITLLVVPILVNNNARKFIHFY